MKEEELIKQATEEIQAIIEKTKVKRFEEYEKFIKKIIPKTDYAYFAAQCIVTIQCILKVFEKAQNAPEIFVRFPELAIAVNNICHFEECYNENSVEQWELR